MLVMIIGCLESIKSNEENGWRIIGCLNPSQEFISGLNLVVGKLAEFA